AFISREQTGDRRTRWIGSRTRWRVETAPSVSADLRRGLPAFPAASGCQGGEPMIGAEFRAEPQLSVALLRQSVHCRNAGRRAPACRYQVRALPHRNYVVWWCRSAACQVQTPARELDSPCWSRL